MLRCINADQIRNLGRRLDTIKHKWFNKIKVIYLYTRKYMS